MGRSARQQQEVVALTRTPCLVQEGGRVCGELGGPEGCPRHRALERAARRERLAAGKRIAARAEDALDVVRTLGEMLVAAEAVPLTLPVEMIEAEYSAGATDAEIGRLEAQWAAGTVKILGDLAAAQTAAQKAVAARQIMESQVQPALDEVLRAAVRIFHRLLPADQAVRAERELRTEIANRARALLAEMEKR